MTKNEDLKELTEAEEPRHKRFARRIASKNDPIFTKNYADGRQKLREKYVSNKNKRKAKASLKKARRLS